MIFVELCCPQEVEKKEEADLSDVVVVEKSENGVANLSYVHDPEFTRF